MNPLQALGTVLRRTGDFRGRSRRAEYWWFLVWMLPVFTLAEASRSPWAELGTALSIVTFLPYLTVSLRRLHDTDRSGWWVLT